MKRDGVTLLAPRPATPSPKDVEVLFQEARRRRRRRWVGWLAILVIVGAAVSLWLEHLGSSATSPTHGVNRNRAALTAPTPAEAVVWTSGHQLVVISTTTGHVVRTLASDVSIAAPGLPDITVGPDGTVFFDSSAASSFDNGSWTGDQIFSVPVIGGTITHVAPGLDPQVSPSGRWIAFLASDAQGEAPYLSETGGVAIRRLNGGAISGVRVLHPGRGQLNRGLSDLSWSSDSRRLSFDLVGTTGLTTAWAIAVNPSTTSLSSAREIKVASPGVTWNGSWGTNRKGQPIGLGIATGSNGQQQVVALDPWTGRVLARLFSVPGQVCVDHTSSTPPACVADFSNALTGDSPGANVLIAGVMRLSQGVPSASGLPRLYRWQLGDHAPIRLASQVERATWVPSMNRN
jgi:hypothetical protein